MKNKNLLIGGAVFAGLLFLYFRNRPTSTNQDEERIGGDAGLGGDGGGAMAQENGGGALMETGQPILVSPNDNTYRPLPPDRVNNTLRPLPITKPFGNPFFAPKPLFGKPSVSTIAPTSPAPRPATNDVSANINQAVSNASNLRNFSTFNGMADGKVNGLDFGGDLD
jgi:hypothetical protein